MTEDLLNIILFKQNDKNNKRLFEENIKKVVYET